MTRRYVHREDDPPAVYAWSLDLENAGTFSYRSTAYTHAGSSQTKAIGRWSQQGNEIALLIATSDAEGMPAGTTVIATRRADGSLTLLERHLKIDRS